MCMIVSGKYKDNIQYGYKIVREIDNGVIGYYQGWCEYIPNEVMSANLRGSRPIRIRGKSQEVGAGFFHAFVNIKDARKFYRNVAKRDTSNPRIIKVKLCGRATYYGRADMSNCLAGSAQVCSRKMSWDGKFIRVR